MTRPNYTFTSESVSEGHPDKICDRISDSILDALIKTSPAARAGVEVFATTNRVVIGGEIALPEDGTTAFMGQVDKIVRDCVREIGYEQEGFHWKDLTVDNYLNPQSAHIAQGVDTGGAGDQGIMFGYAVDETDHFMPAPIHYSHAILRGLSEARHSGKTPDLGPDAKTQLSVRYENNLPVGIDSIVLSNQHLDAKMTSNDVKDIVKPYIMKALPDGWVSDKTVWHVNPTGAFVIGGPVGDAGLTGRKIIVDTYGGAAPHGGGAFSGKDPTKVDRSAAYAARYLAKNVVAAGLAKRCMIQLSYAIGVAEPLSIYCDTYGMGAAKEQQIERVLRGIMDLTPNGIIQHLRLQKPIYARTAAYGHFGRTPTDDGGFSWESTDLIDALKQQV